MPWFHLKTVREVILNTHIWGGVGGRSGRDLFTLGYRKVEKRSLRHERAFCTVMDKPGLFVPEKRREALLGKPRLYSSRGSGRGLHCKRLAKAEKLGFRLQALRVTGVWLAEQLCYRSVSRIHCLLCLTFSIHCLFLLLARCPNEPC